jgi:hypothetical protein
MKTNVLKLIVSGFLLSAVLTACGIGGGPGNLGPLARVSGSGKVVTETRQVGGFDGVIVNGAGNVVIDQTGAESLTITTDDNLLPYITTEVRGGKLVIEFKSGVFFDQVKDLTFRVGAKNLNSIQVDGAANVQGKNIATENLSVELNGAGAITLSGKATEQSVVLDGVGAYNGAELISQRAQVTDNGTGTAVVRVSDQLDAIVNGLGSIEYIGNPQVTKQVSGIGTVRQRP